MRSALQNGNADDFVAKPEFLEQGVDLRPTGSPFGVFRRCRSDRPGRRILETKESVQPRIHCALRYRGSGRVDSAEPLFGRALTFAIVPAHLVTTIRL